MLKNRCQFLSVLRGPLGHLTRAFIYDVLKVPHPPSNTFQWRISFLTLKVTLVLLLCGHPNLLILSSSSLSENYHFSVFELFPYDLRIHVTRFRKYTLSLFIFVIINRGFYMAARRYEISLPVLKNIWQVSAANEWIVFQHEKRNFVCPSGHVVFYVSYKHHWNTKPFHFWK